MFLACCFMLFVQECDARNDDKNYYSRANKKYCMKEQEQIPIFSKWKYWYVFILLVQLMLIILFAWFTKKFS